MPPPAILRRVARVSATLLAMALAFGAARADERPLMLPSRDVDVLYDVSRPALPQQPTLTQRTRWAASLQLLRVDTPSPGLYVVMDYRSHLLSAVRPAQKLVLQVRSDGAGLSVAGVDGAGVGGAGVGGSGGGFTRGGERHVLGLSCTEWRTRDSAGEAADVCLTPDGVLLRARIGNAALIEARRVTYGPVPADLFVVPAEFRRVAPGASLAGKPAGAGPP